MARREVVQVTCDRCKKKDLQDKDQLLEGAELTISYRGSQTVFKDLCMGCRDAVKGYHNRICMIKDDKAEKPAEEGAPPAEEKKRSIFGR